MPPPDAPDTASAHASPERPLRAMHTAVDIGFGVLLIVSGFRYFSNHPFDGAGIGAALLGAGSAIAYAVAVLGAPGRRRQAAGILAATALWLPLAVIAPSFSWCAFALIFAVHRVLPRGFALAMSACIVVAVSTGLFLMSEGQDLGLVLGPFFGGLVISAAYAALDRALENRRQLTDELLATQVQLARSEREAGALAERSRFASELHDTVVQRTASALLLLESNDADPGAAADQTREVLREALVETRQLLHGLRKAETQQTLSAAVAELARDHGAELTVVGDETGPSDDVAHALLRVAQEALINAGKHANASAVRVTLTFFEDSVGIDVADDGPGFDPDLARERSTGYGLRAMAWRIESLGGTFALESAPGQGTVVAGILPLRAGEGAEA